MPKPDPQKLFWKIAEELYSDSTVKEGTMMGFKCLRADGEFFATLDHRTDALIVKLPPERITSLIEDKIGHPFAPAGRTFKQWVSLPEADPHRWRSLLDEAKTFVAQSKKK